VQSENQSLRPMTRKALEGLRAKGVVFDMIEDYDDLAELNGHARDCESPRPSRVTDAILDYPITCAGLKFFDLTIAARLWCRDIAFPALEEHPILHGMAVPFAMCNRTKLGEITEPSQVKRAVWTWTFMKCRKLTQDQLSNILSWFGLIEPEGQDDPTPDTSESDYGNVLAILTREYGGKPEYWIFDAPAEVVQVCINDVITKAFFEHQAMEKANQGAGRNAKAIAPDPNSPQVRAHTLFIRKVREIEKRKKSEVVELRRG